MTLEKAQIGRRTCDHYFAAVHIAAYCAPTFIIVASNQCRPVSEKGEGKGQWMMIIYTQQWKHNSGDMSCVFYAGETHKPINTVQLTFDSKVDTRGWSKNVDWVNFWLPFDRTLAWLAWVLCRFSLHSKRAMNMKRSDSFKVAFNCTLLCTWLRNDLNL